MCFACGIGFFALVFLCATNLEKGNLTVLNGNNQGSKLSELDKIKIPQKRLEAHDVFLDNVTGDVYNYNYDSNEWVAKANVGIHYQRAAEEFNTLGKYVLNAPVFRVKTVDDKQICVSSKSESICYLRKMFLQHWALQGSNHEFLAPAVAGWQIHPFNFKVPEKTFNVLADSKIGPQIILFTNDNILSTQFELNYKYPDTLPSLRKFIVTKLLEIKSLNKYQIVSIFAVDGTWWDSSSNQRGNQKRTNQSQANKTDREHNNIRFKKDPNSEKNQGLDADTFHHVGFSTKDKGFQYVNNNAIAQARSVKMKRRSTKTSGPFTGNVGPIFHPETSASDYNIGNMYKNGVRIRHGKTSSKYVKHIPNRDSIFGDIPANLNQHGQVNNIIDLDNEELMCKKESKHTVRKMLISEWEDDEKLKGLKDDDWVPGYRTFFKLFNNNNVCGMENLVVTEEEDDNKHNQMAKQETVRTEAKTKNNFKSHEEADKSHNQEDEVEPMTHKMRCKPRFYGRYNKEFKYANPDEARNMVILFWFIKKSHW